MEPRDRATALALFGAALAAWMLVAVILTTRDPTVDPLDGYLGALAIGAAVALTAAPLSWLVVFGRHRRIAYQGDWVRAGRRGAWVGLVVAVTVVLRLQGIFQLPILLFIIAMVVVAEAALSADR